MQWKCFTDDLSYRLCVNAPSKVSFQRRRFSNTWCLSCRGWGQTGAAEGKSHKGGQSCKSFSVAKRRNIERQVDGEKLLEGEVIAAGSRWPCSKTKGFPASLWSSSVSGHARQVRKDREVGLCLEGHAKHQGELEAWVQVTETAFSTRSTNRNAVQGLSCEWVSSYCLLSRLKCPRESTCAALHGSGSHLLPRTPASAIPVWLGKTEAMLA